MELSLAEARRIALAAQGFGHRPARPNTAAIRAIAAKIKAIQLDSVNVLVRSHYLPMYSRLGPYPMGTIDTLAYQNRELFECWGHATCLMPVELYPLFRYRTTAIRAMELIGWPEGRSRSKKPEVAAIYDEVAERGPLAAADLSMAMARTSKWWGWDRSKIILETLLDCGLVAAAGRRGFTRLYDIAERAIPRVLGRPAPDAEEAQKELICHTARALGVASGKQLGGYFGLHSHRIVMRGPDGKRPRAIWPRLAEFVAEGRLVQAEIEGWKKPGYLGRCDLKADRERRALLVQGAYVEPGPDPKHVAAELATELRQMQKWLELDTVVVADRGNLADSLQSVLH